jgi:phage shock protein A
MKIFKSKEEKRIEREIEIRKGLNHIRRQIKVLARNERGYLEKARRAIQLGSSDQVAFLKQTLRKTISQRRLMERQLLNIETAIQIKDQVEADAGFAKAMNAVSKSIASQFRSIDLTKTMRNFEEAMEKARTMEERISLMLEMSQDSMLGETADMGDLVSEEEIDLLVEEEAVHEEGTALDAEIEKGLGEVASELKKDRSRNA